MENQDLLALRFPSRVPVRFHVLAADGSRLAGPWEAQGIDVSRTGVRLEAKSLPSDVLKQLADPDQEMMVELVFAVAGLSLPVVGHCRWIRDVGPSGWILGIEYLRDDRSRGDAIARHFEARYTRPKVIRAGAGIALTATVVIGAIFGGLYVQATHRQREAISRANGELRAAVESKQAISTLIDTLEERISKDPSANDFRDQLGSLKKELEEVRKDVTKKSIALAEAGSRTSGDARGLIERGDRFFGDGNLTAALAAYERAVEIEPSRAEPWLKIGILYEFEERPLRALEAYGHYIEFQKDSPDAWEVSQRIGRLYPQMTDDAHPVVGLDPAPGAKSPTAKAPVVKPATVKAPEPR